MGLGLSLGLSLGSGVDLGLGLGFLATTPEPDPCPQVATRTESDLDDYQAVVTRVVPGEQAADAGMKPGCCVVMLNGISITNAYDLVSEWAKARKRGDTVCDIIFRAPTLAVMDLMNAQGGEKKDLGWALTEDGLVSEVTEDGYAESFGIQLGAKVVAIGGYKVEGRAQIESTMDRCIYESTNPNAADSPSAVVRLTPVCNLRVDEKPGLVLNSGGVVQSVEPGSQGDVWGIQPGCKLVTVGMEDVAGLVRRMYQVGAGGGGGSGRGG